MKFTDLLKIKSLVEVTGEKVKEVLKKYELGNACTLTSNGEQVLHQQNISSVVTACDLPKDRIRELVKARGMEWNEEYASRVKKYVASDESVDSYGDIIRQEGWDFSRFEQNPALMWVHDYSQPNIGTCIHWEINEQKQLILYNLFATAEVYPFADVVYKLVDAGMMKGNSVGFLAKKVMYVEDEDERAALGLGRWGVVFLESTLIEDTICPIGANSNALVQDAIVAATRKGLIDKGYLGGVLKSESPDSVKMLVDRAMSILSGAASVTTAKSEPEQEPTPEPSIIDQLKHIWEDTLASIKAVGSNIDTFGKRIDMIDAKLLTIENDLSAIKSEHEDETPEPVAPVKQESQEQESSEHYIDELLGMAKTLSLKSEK